MKTKQLVYIAMFTVLTAVGGFISIPLPFTVIELTFQVLFVIMAGFFLNARDAALSQIIYLLIGLIGLPVFSKGGGISYVFEPSFGYLISFPLAACVSGAVLRRFRTLRFVHTLIAALAGLVIVNIIGPLYQIMIMLTYLHLPVEAVITAIPFVFFYMAKDAVLLFILCLIYPRLKGMIRLYAA